MSKKVIIVFDDTVGLLAHPCMSEVKGYSDEGYVSYAKWMYPSLKEFKGKILVIDENEPLNKFGKKAFALETDKALRKLTGMKCE